MSEKIYIGNGKRRTFDNGGEIISITITLDGLKKYFDLYGFTTDAGKKKIRLDVSKRREPDKYGNTHTVTINTWKPDPEQKPKQEPNQAPNANDDFMDDVPF